jgi:tetratricopeptide (TPR) repeat protein
MKRSQRIAMAAATTLVLSLAASAALLWRIDQIRSTATLDDSLYLTSPKLLKRLSLGYNGLLADIYWTRVVQYYGAMHHNGGGEYKLLWPLLNLTTQLDPHLTRAYEFGGAFLSASPPMGAGLPDRAVELVEYGIRENPDNWHLYYDLGFIHYDLKNYPAAASAFLRGSKLPNAHPFLKTLAARMAEHGGDTDTARMMWTTTYENSTDKDIRDNALVHLRALKVDQDVTELERRAGVYKGNFKVFPQTFQDMVVAGLLDGIPADPTGHEYKLEPGGKVVVSHPDDLPFIVRGLPTGYSPSDVLKINPAKLR